MNKRAGLLCTLWVLMVAGATASLGAQAPDRAPVLVLEEEVPQRISFYDSLRIYWDTSGRADVEAILSLPETAFGRPPQSATGSAPFVVWAKLKVKNNSQSDHHLYFGYCLEADGYWTYSIAQGKVVNQQYTGKDVKSKERALPARYHYTPVSLEADTERTYLFKLHFNGQVSPEHWVHLTLRPQQPLLHFTVAHYAWHVFYAGLMLSFCLFSFYLFLVFRERSFAFFALQTLSFVLYFAEASGIVEALFTNWFQAQGIYPGEWIISGIVMAGFLFISEYLQLRRLLPKLYWIFLSFSVVCTGYTHVAALMDVPFMSRAMSTNMLLFFWVVLCVAPMVYLTIRGQKEATILLSSFAVLVAGALLFLAASQIVEAGQWGFVFFQSGTVLSSGILFYGLFDRINTIQREKQRMEELDELKSRFFANISHEFRTPLTLMMGPLRQLMERTQDPEQKKLLSMAQRNAGRQLQLVNQLLELSTLEAGKMELGASTQNLIPFLKGVVHAYDSLAVQKGIQLSLDCPEGEMLMDFNEEKLETVFYNLLSNAFKFTPAGGRISVQLKRENRQAVITVSDTGAGIDKEALPHIFERFFRAEVGRNEGIEGSGIGLALTRELVELHQGSISVESEPGKGTRFFLRFPLPATKAIAESGTSGRNPDAPLVLIIEDHVDLRAFIRQRLHESFRVVEAVNGQEGIDRALDIMPDLIISDVMMPEKDGYEVCQTLKTDLRTCHIPIILLTAKAAQAEKLAGLETGADDYLTKPFDFKELLVRAENLIQLRQQLRQRFADSIELRPSEVVTNSRDQAFLEQVLQIVEKHIADEQFSVDTLASEAGMSRTNLNRKLRALVNQSSNQFIQSVRLQRAADLLRQQAGSVAEIALQTGFSSTAYFVKCFKDKFGQTPGSFLEKP